MKLGLQIPDFTWAGGAETLGPTLATIAKTADDAGFDKIAVMDHFFQIQQLGPPEHEMLGGVRGVSTINPLQIIGERVIPAVAKLEPQGTRATA